MYILKALLLIFLHWKKKISKQQNSLKTWAGWGPACLFAVWDEFSQEHPGRWESKQTHLRDGYVIPLE